MNGTETLASRCRHDMEVLDGRSTCSICRGLSDEVGLDADEPTVRLIDDDPAPTKVAWLPVERGVCAACEGPIRDGGLAAWSQRLEGAVGKCCAMEVES